ncbi:unnamed protein product, partial [Ixodes pacificus]
LEFLAFPGVFLSLGDDVEEVFREDKGHPLTVDAKLLLEVAQEVAPSNVTHLSFLVDHDVVRIPVPNAQDECGDAVASTGQGERLNGLLGGGVPLPLVLLPNPLVQLGRVHLEGRHAASLLLDVHDRLGVAHHLDHAHLLPRCNHKSATTGRAPEIKPFLLPDAVHYPDDLQRERSLAISILENDLVVVQYLFCQVIGVLPEQPEWFLGRVEDLACSTSHSHQVSQDAAVVQWRRKVLQCLQEIWLGKLLHQELQPFL